MVPQAFQRDMVKEGNFRGSWNWKGLQLVTRGGKFGESLSKNHLKDLMTR